MDKRLCSKVKDNPYVILNNGEIGLKLNLVEEKDEVLIFEKKYDDQAGFIIVACIEKLDENNFKRLYNFYCEFIKERAYGMFKEVELVFVSKEISKEVEKIINAYREIYAERKPIRHVIIT